MLRFRAPAGHARAAAAVAGLILALGLSGAAGACGRIGYGLLPEGAHPPADASTDRTAPPDATADTATDGPADSGPSDSPDGGEDGPAMDAAADASPEADAGCPDSAVTDYCNFLPSMTAAPVIDGTLDLSPCYLVDMQPEFWSGPAPLPPFPAGNATQIAAAWRPDGLYVFLAVTTPADFPADAGDPVFFGAGVELFVDDNGVYASPPAYDNPGTIQIVITSPATSTTPAARAEMYRNAADLGPWTSTQFGTFPTATGFTFEGFVAAADLGLAAWPLSPGAPVGFDVAVDVSFTTAAMTGPQGHRVGQYFFHVAPADAGVGSPFADPRSFCLPVLAAAAAQ